MTDPFAVFDLLYKQGGWSGKGSGPGSAPMANLEYLRLLQTIISTPGLKTVLDIGCGDWQLMRCVDLRNVTYLGIDVAPTVIAANQRQFTKPNISFQVSNLIVDDLPPTKFIILKDVLQHLPTAHVLTILEKVQRPGCQVLITNDWAAENGPDIAIGGYRPLNLFASPFSVAGLVVAAHGNKRSVLI